MSSWGIKHRYQFLSQLACVAAAALLHLGLWLCWSPSSAPRHHMVPNASSPALSIFTVIPDEIPSPTHQLAAKPVETINSTPSPTLATERKAIEKKATKQKNVHMREQQPAPQPVEQTTTTSPPPSPSVVQSHSTTVTEPVVVKKPQFLEPPQHPAYPPVARRRGQQGTVWLEILLSHTGQQLELSLLRSSGFAALDEAARVAVSTWQLAPYRVNGVAVLSRVQIPVQFTIQ